MKTAMLGLLAETPVHPGSGRGMGVVDLPVAREASTDYPVLFGSGLKGALRDKLESAKAGNSQQEANKLFGEPDKAGDLIVSDGRLLLLPVRSLTDSFCWATCPYLIERYKRDLIRVGLIPGPSVPKVEKGSVLAVGRDSKLFLEERQFTLSESSQLPELACSIAPLIFHEEAKNRLVSMIAVLNNSDFAWFARYGLSIQARNVLEDGTKKSQNLWYEETLPPDTVMYSVCMGRSDKAVGALCGLFPKNDPYLQIGGNETVGQGWFAVIVRERDEEVSNEDR